MRVGGRGGRRLARTGLQRKLRILVLTLLVASGATAFLPTPGLPWNEGGPSGKATDEPDDRSMEAVLADLVNSGESGPRLALGVAGLASDGTWTQAAPRDLHSALRQAGAPDAPAPLPL